LNLGLNTRIFLTPYTKQKVFIDAGINVYKKIGGQNEYYSNSNSTTLTSNSPLQKKFLVAPSISLGYYFSNFSFFINYQTLGEQVELLESS
jgi:hypothetical protein